MVKKASLSNLLLAALVCLWPASARPEASAWVELGEVRLRLVAAHTDPGGAGLLAGVQMQLQPGWKTYWRDPGDAGIPPSFDWSVSRNLAQAELLWPAPHRFSAYGLDSYGYEGEVVFPIRVQPTDESKALELNIAVDFGVCEEICVPASAELALQVASPPARAADAVHAALLRAALARVPRRDGTGPVRLGEARWSAAGTQLEVPVRADRPLTAPELFLEGLRTSEPVRFLPAADARGGRVLLRLTAEEARAASRRALRLTVVDGDGAAERELPPPAGG